MRITLSLSLSLSLSPLLPPPSSNHSRVKMAVAPTYFWKIPAAHSSHASPSRSPLVSLTFAAFPPLLRRSIPVKYRRKGFHPSATADGGGKVTITASIGKLADTELVPIPSGSEEIEGKFPSGSGVYAVYDKSGGLQFIGLSRNIAASIAGHGKALPDLCCSVKVGLITGPVPDRTVLTDAWKSWMEEHIAATGAVPPGNETGNNTWVRRAQKKPNLRLTPGRHVQLTVPLEELIDRLVKENKVVAFIKGTRSAPQCGFSQRVVGILELQGVDFECVDVLDEEYNCGLRETLKKYSNWPTFPQVFVGGELVGGCDIISSMQEKGELTKLLQN